jgi:hypothetical protein
MAAVFQTYRVNHNKDFLISFKENTLALDNANVLLRLKIKHIQRLRNLECIMMLIFIILIY